MSEETVIPVVQHETEPKVEVKHVDLPPYYTEETWKIAQERSKK